MIRKRDPLSDVNVLELRPVPLARAEEVGDRVVLHRPTPRERGLRRPFAWFFYYMSARRIRLDRMGSFVWRELDGRQSVADIAIKLRAEFGEDVEPAEGRLGYMIRVMRREGLIAYPEYDEVDTSPVDSR